MDASSLKCGLRNPLALGLVGTVITLAAAEIIVSGFGLLPVDDAFISLRYAANWAGGRGLCFNPGETVEGYTNFLLVLLEAALIRCGADPVTAMYLAGRAALGILGGLLVVAAGIFLFKGRPLLALAAGVVSGLNAVLVCWGASGMESCLYAVLVLGGLTAAAADNRFFGTVISALLTALAAMTRPEAVILFPVTLAAVYRGKRPLRRALLHAAVLGAVFGSYFCLRAWYFGFLFPNTFYVKLDYGGSALFRRGGRYLWNFIRSCPPLVLLAGCSLALAKGAPRWVKIFLVAAAAITASVVYTGGDHFAMFRFMVPLVPVLSILGFYPAAAALDRLRSRRPAVLITAVCLLGVAASGPLTAGFLTSAGDPQFARFYFEGRLAAEWLRIGGWLRLHAAPGASLATIAIGAVGYASDMRIIDPHGIINPAVAHLDRELGTGTPGHEKFDTAALLAEHPGYILLINRLTVSPVPLEAVGKAAWGEFNRELARMPELYERYRYEIIPLDRRFLQLFVRNDLPPLQQN